MTKKDQKAAVSPASENALKAMGASLRRVRLARRLSISSAAARVGVSTSTLNRIERGDPSVAMGAYAAVFNAFDLLPQLLQVAEEEAAKALRLMTDRMIPQRVRASPKRYDF